MAIKESQLLVAKMKANIPSKLSFKFNKLQHQISDCCFSSHRH